MNLEQSDLLGNPFVGVFACTNDDVTLLPSSTPQRFVDLVRRVLGTEPVKTHLCNSSLLGIFCCLNNNGAAVPSTAYEDEIRILEECVGNVVVVEGFTALGNLVTCNDKGCVASPLLPDASVSALRKALGVKPVLARIAGVDITGSCVAATNSGFLVNPNVSGDEFKALEKVFHTRGGVGSLNYGNPFVKGGILANSRGAIVGSTTTPFEMSRVDEAFS